MRTLAAALLLATGLGAQMLDPGTLLHPTPDVWPMYNGDYSGRRFSPLAKIHASNIDSLSLAWVYRIPAADSGAIKSTPVLLNGVLYFTLPDRVWAIDARDGREVWNFTWQSKGGIHIGNRGVGVYGNWLYFETPDCNLVSLNLKDGKERWHAPICDLDQFYFGSIAPLIVKNHVITGVSGDDLDIPGYLESHDPRNRRAAMALLHAPQQGRRGS
ncbi:MAG: PQQ-binding-like beta-propeller repeat protein [Ignavibacteriota bacterium]